MCAWGFLLFAILAIKGNFAEHFSLVPLFSGSNPKTTVLFFGSGTERFIQHLSYLLHHTYQSSCTSVDCPEHCLELSKYDFPLVSGSDDDTSKFTQDIKTWLEDEWVGGCGRIFDSSPPENAMVYLDINDEM